MWGEYVVGKLVVGVEFLKLMVEVFVDEEVGLDVV